MQAGTLPGRDAAGLDGASLGDVELYLREPRQFTISDGRCVEGWLIRDPGTAGPGPLLLDIHGGPHNAWNGAADPAHVYHQVLAARGWTVLLLNPRASDGYGEAFYTAAVGAWGVADARDFLEPLEELIAEGTADPARLAVTGYSYGGYMTCYLTSRDSRFAAAVAGGAVCDLTSMAGTSDAARELSDWEWGADSPRGRDFSASDPITRVADVTTPTLLLHGDADIRCPVGQAEEWHVALRELGVDTQLVRYPGASHLFILDGMPSHRIDYNQRVVDWVEQYASTTKRPKIDSVRSGSGHWQRRLAVLAERHKVPGASLGILRLGTDGRPDELVEAAYGFANAPAKIEATSDTLFQIGSMSKVWTATVVMQLVDEGKLDLDAPVAEVLPEFQLADADVAKTVTVRQLLSHTSGIDGDVFTDTGRGDDCVEKYVGLMADIKQNHPLGATWSYCNSGFTLAGRVIEKLTGLTWDAALREKLFAPLGLGHTVTLPEEALLFRTAAGHVDVTAEPVLAPVWQLPRSLGPAGLINSIPADVLAFAKMHLTGGLAADGTRVLSAASTAAMTEFQADVPDKYVLGDSWGIGWIRFGWDGQRLVGHDGNTIGQAAFLRILPEAGIAVTLLTHGGHTRDLYGDLYEEIFAALAGVAMPTPIAPPAEPPATDITPHLGRYERAGVLMEILPGAVLEDGGEIDGLRCAPRSPGRSPSSLLTTWCTPTRCTRSARTCTWSASPRRRPGCRSPSTPWPPASGTCTSVPGPHRRWLTDVDHELVPAMEARLPGILADIEELVRCESPSSVLDAVSASAALVAAVGERHLGAAPEQIVIDGRSHLRWRFGETTCGTSRRVLLLAHHDTVWPLGSLETHPFSVRDGGAARARLLRHEGRPRPRAARAGGTRCARRGDVARHRGRRARLAVVARADRIGGGGLRRGARARGVGGRRRAEDGTQGRIALPGAGGGTRRACRA